MELLRIKELPCGLIIKNLKWIVLIIVFLPFWGSFSHFNAHSVVPTPKAQPKPFVPQIDPIQTAHAQIIPLEIPDIWSGYSFLKRIASCESSGNVSLEPRQFNSDGSILWGHDPKLWDLTGATTTDVGELQISLYWHGAEVKALGLDVVHSEADNIAYGKILYARNGARAWSASKNCWK